MGFLFLYIDKNFWIYPFLGFIEHEILSKIQMIFSSLFEDKSVNFNQLFYKKDLNSYFHFQLFLFHTNTQLFISFVYLILYTCLFNFILLNEFFENSFIVDSPIHLDSCKFFDDSLSLVSPALILPWSVSAGWMFELSVPLKHAFHFTNYQFLSNSVAQPNLECRK